MNRQKIALALLLVILVCAIAYSFLGRPKQRRVERLKFTAGMTASSFRPSGRTDNGARLRIDLLDRENTPFSGFRRNIFRPVFFYRTEVPFPAKPLKQPPPPPPPPPKTPAQIAMEEIGRFSFLGYLHRNNRKTVFLTRDNQIFLVRKGDRIAGMYDVDDISENMITIALAPGGEKVVVPLAQNRPLAP
jgi:preprotein translocase subunit YajC